MSVSLLVRKLFALVKRTFIKWKDAYQMGKVYFMFILIFHQISWVYFFNCWNVSDLDALRLMKWVFWWIDVLDRLNILTLLGTGDCCYIFHTLICSYFIVPGVLEVLCRHCGLGRGLIGNSQDFAYVGYLNKGKNV